MAGNERKINYWQEAFKEKLNITGVAAIFLSAAALANPFILAGGVVAEALYLAITSNARGYKRLIDDRYEKEGRKQQEEKNKKLLYQLSTDQQLRYKRLERMRDKLVDSRKEMGDDVFELFSDELDKVDDLLYSFLNLSTICTRYRRHLKKFSRKEMINDINDLNRKLEKDEAVKSSPKAQNIIRKNINILERRLKKINNIRGNLSALEAQIETIEDILGLFHDQMVTLKSPGDISQDLNELITNVQLTHEAIEETDAFLNDFKKLDNHLK